MINRDISKGEALMKRRETFRLIPVSLACFGSLAQKAGAWETGDHSGNSTEQLPLALVYPKNIVDMLTWVRETQSENILESAYAIARTVLKGRTCWINWDQGHSTSAEMFPGRDGLPGFLTLGYDPKKARNGDLLIANRTLPEGGYEDLAKKDIFVIGSSSPVSGDVRGFEFNFERIQKNRIRPFADIWIETNITSIGALIKIPGMPAPIGPVTGPLFITLMWMMVADACRILSIEGKSGKVYGDEPELSGDKVNWVNVADPLMDNFLEEVIREMELIGAELGDIRKVASMAVDTLLNGGTVYYYSRYDYTFMTEATGRRGGPVFADRISDGNIKGTPKDCVIMGIYKPDDEADLKNLDEFKKIGMRVASIGPITRNFEIPEGRTIHKETEVHVGRMMDTYGLFAVPGFEKKVCPTSGIIMFTIHWAISMEIIEQIRKRTNGNIPAVHFSGSLKWGSDYNKRMRTMVKDRGY